MMNQCGKVNGGVRFFFSHGTHHSKSVCILLDPTINSNVEYFFSNNTGRIVLITTCLNGVKTSLCNIYAPNSQSDQLEFIQELNNCIVDKSEMTNIIIGGDWTCALTKKDKKGGAFWKPTPFRNLLLTTMETFDLIDIYRARHPNLQLFSYESKSLQVKSRIDFFLVAKSLVKYVSKVGITVSIAPDHKATYFDLSLPVKVPRGSGFWKFNNALLDDEVYVAHIRKLVPQIRDKYSQCFRQTAPLRESRVTFRERPPEKWRKGQFSPLLSLGCMQA